MSRVASSHMRFSTPPLTIGVDYIVDKGNLHRADLLVIIVLIEEHHTLEHGEEKYLYSADDQYKRKNCGGDFGKKSEIR